MPAAVAPGRAEDAVAGPLWVSSRAVAVGVTTYCELTRKRWRGQHPSAGAVSLTALKRRSDQRPRIAGAPDPHGVWAESSRIGETRQCSLERHSNGAASAVDGMSDHTEGDCVATV